MNKQTNGLSSKFKNIRLTVWFDRRFLLLIKPGLHDNAFVSWYYCLVVI